MTEKLTLKQTLLVEAARREELNGNGPIRGSNGENVIRYFAVNEPALLKDIIAQARRSALDRTFWHGMFSHSDLTQPEWEQRYRSTVERRVRHFRHCHLLLDQARKHLREHPGNSEWAVMQNIMLASDFCADGGLDETEENLRAALYTHIITSGNTRNLFGANNELICYMAERIDAIEESLDRFNMPILAIAHLESFFDKSVPSSLRDGFL